MIQNQDRIFVKLVGTALYERLLKLFSYLPYLNSSLILFAVDKLLFALPATSSLRFDMAGFKKERSFTRKTPLLVLDSLFFTFGKNNMAAAPCAHPQSFAHTVKETGNDIVNICACTSWKNTDNAFLTCCSIDLHE